MNSESNLPVKIREELKRIEDIRILGQMTACVVHELKNVIGIVAFSAETLSHQMKLEGEVKEYVDVIHRNADQAAQIVKELLDFARKKETPSVVGNIHDIVQASLKLVYKKCAAHHIEIKTQFSNENPTQLIHPLELKSAFLNLLLNAIEAMPNGGILNIETIYNETQRQYHVLICDTGTGILEENISKIGDAFFTTKSEGSGLGIYMTRQILERHHSKLIFTNNPNSKGTRAELTFFIQ